MKPSLEHCLLVWLLLVGRTDELVSLPLCDLPAATPCLKENTCFSNYHSCADITINGTAPLTNGTKVSQPRTPLPLHIYGESFEF